jgi:hypothetical protein
MPPQQIFGLDFEPFQNASQCPSQITEWNANLRIAVPILGIVADSGALLRRWQRCAIQNLVSWLTWIDEGERIVNS